MEKFKANFSIKDSCICNLTSVATGLGHSGHLGHFLSGSKWVSPRHSNVPDPDQKYLVIVRIKNCNKKINTL